MTTERSSTNALTPEQQQRRDYYEAKPHKALELLNAVENLEAEREQARRIARRIAAEQASPEELIAVVEAERAFLDASIAVWRRIDAVGLQMAKAPTDEDVELRHVERATWERYRDLLPQKRDG